MTTSHSRLRGFAVRGVLWRHYMDWASVNVPFFLYPVLQLFWSFFFFFFAAPARRAILDHLTAALPGSSRAMNYLRALRTFHNYAWTISEASIHNLIKEEFAYEIVGADWLNQLGAAQGAIVLTAHIGSYDLGAALFAEKFSRAIRIVRAPEPDQDSERHLTSSLEKGGDGGITVNYNTAGALLSFDLLNALRLGEIVSIQGDRVAEGLAEIPAQLFGRRVRLPTGPFALAQVAQVPIYPLFITRSSYRRYQIIVREPITVPRTGPDREEDIAPAVNEWRTVLEQTIAEHWDQWYTFTPGFLLDEQNQ